MIGWEKVTVWRRGSGRWVRFLYSGVRVEREEGEAPSAVGPTTAGATRVFFPVDPDVRPGDALQVGASREAGPPAEALTVATVKPWYMRGGHHHTEVTAR